MSNKVEPSREMISYFRALGFEYKIVTDSVYMDERDTPVHYFQSDDADGSKICSTILADDARKLYENVQEPFSRRVAKAFGERCPAGHLLSLQPCRQCKKPDGRSKKKPAQPTHIKED